MIYERRHRYLEYILCKGTRGFPNLEDTHRNFKHRIKPIEHTKEGVKSLPFSWFPRFQNICSSSVSSQVFLSYVSDRTSLIWSILIKWFDENICFTLWKRMPSWCPGFFVASRVSKPVHLCLRKVIHWWSIVFIQDLHSLESGVAIGISH